MDTLVIVALAPFYALGLIAVSYALAYACHMLRRIDQSATETVATEATVGK